MSTKAWSIKVIAFLVTLFFIIPASFSAEVPKTNRGTNAVVWRNDSGKVKGAKNYKGATVSVQPNGTLASFEDLSDEGFSRVSKKDVSSYISGPNDGYDVYGINPVDTEIERDSSGNILYIGFCHPGSAYTEAQWAIQKFEYTDGELKSIRWANGTLSFTKQWSARSDYDYSK